MSSTLRLLGEITEGLVILVVTVGLLTIGVLCATRMPVFVIVMLLWPVFSFAVNAVWFAVNVGLVLHGTTRSKPGLALAPLIFAALWLGASVASRLWLQASLDPKVWERPISPDASAQRTLIVRASDSVDRKIIVDGHVDRLIKVGHDEHNKITDIEEISLAGACSAEQKRASPQLQKAGSTDACLRARSLAEIPDGLVVDYVTRSGCCGETQARLRIGGQERPLFSWYSGEARVLPYLPVFSFVESSTGLWEAGKGVIQPVHYGLDDIAPVTMISAIYGVAPAYRQDVNLPLPRPLPSAADSLAQAETFAKQANVSPKGVAALLIAARDNGLVNERSIGIAASLVGHGNDGWNALTDFAKDLTDQQIELLVEKLLERLATPNICDDCVASQYAKNPSLRDWKLRERLSNPETFQDQAIRAFVERHDLAAWQYEGWLRIIASLGPQEYPAADRYFETSVLALLFIDDTPAYSDKAIAFLRATSSRPTGEGTKLAARLDQVRDRDLMEYITRIWPFELHRLAKGERPDLYAIAAKACRRIAQVKDRAVREQDFGVDCLLASR